MENNYNQDVFFENSSDIQALNDYASPKTKESDNKKIMILLVIIVLVIYVVYPIGKKYLENKWNTFYVTVEVEKVFQPGRYESGMAFIDLDKPVMKCRIVSINRNNYQKNHTINGEPKIDDVMFLTEIHGDSYPQFTRLDLTIKRNQIIGGQFVRYYDDIERFSIPSTKTEEEVEIKDTFSVSTEESETYIQDLKEWIPDDQEANIQEYLKEKYSETGIRMYIIFFDTNDETYMNDYSKALLNSKSSRAITYSRNANDSSWHMWWRTSTDEEKEYINSHYTKVGDAYLIYGNYEERLKNVIDTAYSLFE
ncbi:MAG: hypothetical protein J5476_12705 [Lachnospiraceae bacterium]|nr:hypothetical protein [Lachnospiraceae bacterium]